MLPVSVVSREATDVSELPDESHLSPPTKEACQAMTGPSRPSQMGSSDVMQELRSSLNRDFRSLLEAHREILLRDLVARLASVPKTPKADTTEEDETKSGFYSAHDHLKPPTASEGLLRPSWRSNQSQGGVGGMRLDNQSRRGSSPRPSIQGDETLPAAAPVWSGASSDIDNIDEQTKHRATQVGQEVGTSVSRKMPKNLLQTVVESAQFEAFFGLAILTNAIFIAVQTDYAAVQLTYDVPFGFQIIGILYTAIFTLELLVRVAAERCKFFRYGSDTWHWNYLDILIVVSSNIELLMDAAGAGEGNNGISQLRIMRILRVTRVIRIVRVTRIIRFIRALRTLVNQIVFTIKSLVWALLLLCLVIFLFGIAFTQYVTTYHIELKEDGALIEQWSAPLTAYWGSLPRSMMTLYKAITGGISWEEVVLPLSDTGYTTVALFIAYISFAQLAVLNVLTGVFCQNAIDSAHHDQELVAQQILAQKGNFVQRLQQIFKNMDADGSGELTIQEFTEHLDDPKVKAIFESLELDTSDIWALFKLMDSDNGHVLDLDEFVSGCMRLKGAAKGLDMAKLSYDIKFMNKRVGKIIRRFEDRTLSAVNEILWTLNGDRLSERFSYASAIAGIGSPRGPGSPREGNRTGAPYVPEEARPAPTQPSAPTLPSSAPTFAPAPPALGPLIYC